MKNFLAALLCVASGCASAQTYGSPHLGSGTQIDVPGLLFGSTSGALRAATGADVAGLLSGVNLSVGTLTGSYTGINNALTVTANVVGSGSGTGVALVNIPSDAGNQGNNFGIGLSVQSTFGGAQASGGRILGQFLFNQTAPDSGTSALADYIGILGNVTTSTGSNGTSLAPRGDYYGGWLVSHLKNGAMYAGAMEGLEVNISSDTGSSVVHKTGVLISHGGLGDDTQQGSQDDSDLWIFTGNANSPGAKVGVQFGWATNPSLGLGVATTGTLVKSFNGTVANGTDYSATIISGCAFKSTGYCVDGSGNVGMAPTLSLNSPSTNANITMKGVVGGSPATLAQIAYSGTTLNIQNSQVGVDSFQFAGGSTSTIDGNGFNGNVGATTPANGTFLNVKVSGQTQFGTYTSGACTNAGYVTIVDAGGTGRKLMVCQ